jgi:RNA:NAD 2'-phosphotransferase (TPT1/KptA family)
MSHLLRHGAVEAGLGDVMDASGYVPVRDVLALPRFAGITEADVRHLVASCPKRRFELRGDGKTRSASEESPSDGVARNDATICSSSSLSIRAAQGHTMRCFAKLDDDQMLTRLDQRAADAVSSAAHGTSLAAWAKIRGVGISRAKRRHVHMARNVFGTTLSRGPEEGTNDTEPEDDARDESVTERVVVSGFRKDARVAVLVDVARGVREGVPFFLSSNGVVLSPGEGDTGTIPTRLFLRAVDLKTGEALALVGSNAS